MKYLLILALLSSCSYRWTIETPWTTADTLFWNPPCSADCIPSLTVTQDSVVADYPEFEAKFVIYKDHVFVQMDHGRKFYKSNLIKSSDVFIGQISEKEFVRIHIPTKITTVYIDGLHRKYIAGYF